LIGYSEYDVVLLYCNHTGRPTKVILMHLAEYRALGNLYTMLLREDRTESAGKVVVAEKIFEIERNTIRENNLRGITIFLNASRHFTKY
jgi:hypothetical protein